MANRRWLIAAGTAAAFAAGGFAFASSIAGAGNGGGFTPGSTVGPGDHVPICHALGNGGYNAISPSAGVVFGHAGASHQDGRDIIPPFTYRPKKGALVTTLASGQNWSTGAAVWANGCAATTTTKETTTEETTTEKTTTEQTTTARTTTAQTTTAETTTAQTTTAQTTTAQTTTVETTTAAGTTAETTTIVAPTTVTTAPFTPPVQPAVTTKTTPKKTTPSAPYTPPKQPKPAAPGGLAHTP